MTLEAQSPLIVAAFVALRALLQKSPGALDEKSTQTLKSLSVAETAALRAFEVAGQRCLEHLGEEVVAVLRGAQKEQDTAVQQDYAEGESTKSKETEQASDHDVESVRMLFEQFDLDGDGLISCKDFKEDVLIPLGLGDQMREEEINNLVEAADEDKDGFINLSEFTNWLFSSSGKKVMRFAMTGNGSKVETIVEGSDEGNAEGQTREEDLAQQLCEMQAKLEDSNKKLDEIRAAKVAHEKVAKELKVSQEELEEDLNATNEFWRTIAKVSESPQLEEMIDLETAELLGNGKYAIVFKAKRRSDDNEERKPSRDGHKDDTVVVKMMTVRWSHVACREWHLGKLVQGSPLIVGCKEGVLHADKDKVLARLIQEGLEKGQITLPGRKPGLTGSKAELPDRHLCLFQEFMNQGSVQNWMDQDRLDNDRMFAALRELASALAYMHKAGLAHNDVKPENLMLTLDKADTFIRVKLGDLGLSRRSLDRSADSHMYAMSAFCMVTKEHFGARKIHPDSLDPLIDDLSKIVKAQLRELDDSSSKMDDALTSLLKLPAQLRKVWTEKVNMAQLQEWPPLQGWTFRPLAAGEATV